MTNQRRLTVVKVTNAKTGDFVNLKLRKSLLFVLLQSAFIISYTIAFNPGFLVKMKNTEQFQTVVDTIYTYVKTPISSK